MKMTLLISVFIALQCISLASSVPVARQRRQLPCTHPLRISVPELFTHCNSAPCTYGGWSSWERIPRNETTVPQSQCPSGKAYTEERTRPTTGSGCNQPVRETRRICKHDVIVSTYSLATLVLIIPTINTLPGLPTRDELLILALGLGGSGNNYDPINRPPPPDPPGPLKPSTLSVAFCVNCRPRPVDSRRCPSNGRNGQICSHIPGK